jgi:hypothetical protein
MNRCETNKVKVGNITIGGSNHVVIQSMCNIKTSKVDEVVAQIKELEAAGCELIRVSVLDMYDAKAIKDIVERIDIPLVADIHYDYRLALQAMESGAQKIRLNPGNLRTEEQIVAVINKAKEKNVAIRIGVNSGSINPEYVKANGGKVDTKTIKSEIGRIFQIDDENKINALWQNAVQEYGSDENVLNALLTEIGDNTSDESIQSAMMKVLNYTPMEESQIFKCGGKLQQLVTKFRKGGPVDCGCGGIKLNQRGGVTGPFNNVPDRYYNENGVFLGYGNDPRIMDYINSRGNDRT